jgi:NAD-dependent oxidoreductase involved in siderophore biosynthesis
LTPVYFAYGSNMASAEMETWCPEARFLGPARLDGHRLALNRRSIRWGAGVVDLVPSEGESVWGALYDVPDLDRLDAKEGAGFAYRRIEVEPMLDAQPVTAVAYEVIDKEEEEITPSPEYVALLVDGARERGLPEQYVRGLEDR